MNQQKLTLTRRVPGESVQPNKREPTGRLQLTITHYLHKQPSLGNSYSGSCCLFGVTLRMWLPLFLMAAELFKWLRSPSRVAARFKPTDDVFTFENTTQSDSLVRTRKYEQSITATGVISRKRAFHYNTLTTLKHGTASLFMFVVCLLFPTWLNGNECV